VYIYRTVLFTLDQGRLLKPNLEVGIKLNEIRKGMVLLDLKSNPYATKLFEAEIWTVDGSRKTVKTKYQPVLYIRNIRQGVKIRKFTDPGKNKKRKLTMVDCEESVVISSCRRTKIIFEFLYFPEFLAEGTNLIINDNLLKAYGVITKLYK